MSGDPVEVVVPGDKSISHRALIFAALAEGESRLSGLLAAEDTQATAKALRLLGCPVPDLPRDGGEILVRGVGLRGFTAPQQTIDCANSGTTARLLLGMLAGQRFSARLDGDASLRRRPMRRVTEPLSRVGARFDEEGEPGRLPITVTGGDLAPIAYIGPHASAQVKSALLLAGLCAGTSVRVSEPVASRDHTERLLRALGADVQIDADPPPTVRLKPLERLNPLVLTVPGDFSSAAFFLALGILTNGRRVRVRGVGINAGRIGLLKVLRRMDAELHVIRVGESGGEPVGDVEAAPSQMRGTEIGGDELPGLIDEVPILAALAALADGETRITGAGELRVKESDRLAGLVANLRRLGVDAHELPDGLTIRGGRRALRGRLHTFGDHRLAMAFGVLATLPGNDIEIDRPDVVAVSFPGFWDELRRCAREVSAR